MSFLDRLQEVIPHGGRAWLEALAIAVGLVVVIFVVLPRLVKVQWLRWTIAAGLVLIAGWLTVLPVFFDKEAFNSARGEKKGVNYLYADGHIKNLLAIGGTK